MTRNKADAEHDFQEHGATTIDPPREASFSLKLIFVVFVSELTLLLFRYTSTVEIPSRIKE